MSELSGRAIIITGASSGIGRVTAVTLGAEGADLWLVGRSEEELRNTADQVTAAGGPAPQIAPMDLRERGPLAALVAKVGSLHPHLFAIINNAGLMHPEPILSGTIDRWQAMLDVNVMAVLEGSKAAVEVMRAQHKPGHIVNVSSLISRFEVAGVYGVTKRGVETIGASLRAELEQDDIRVATIIPGGFATNLARGLAPAHLDKFVAGFTEQGIDLSSPDAARLLGDPQHVANAIRYVLAQPIDINIQEMIVRPPVDLKI